MVAEIRIPPHLIMLQSLVPKKLSTAYLGGSQSERLYPAMLDSFTLMVNRVMNRVEHCMTCSPPLNTYLQTSGCKERNHLARKLDPKVKQIQWKDSNFWNFFANNSLLHLNNQGFVGL
jgi:hypothetical protein